MATSVFLSYSHLDRGYVERLAAQLDGLGFGVWYDHSIAAGEQFGPVIQAAIDRCGAFVPILTPNAVTSKWVMRELVYADEQDKPIFPVLLKACQRPLILAGLQFEEVGGGVLPPSDGFVGRLRAATNTRVARRAVVKAPAVAVDPALPFAVAQRGFDRAAVDSYLEKANLGFQLPMPKFAVVEHGYDPDEVNGFVKLVKSMGHAASVTPGGAKRTPSGRLLPKRPEFPPVSPGYAPRDVDKYLDDFETKASATQSTKAMRRPTFKKVDMGYRPKAVHRYLRHLATIFPELFAGPAMEALQAIPEGGTLS